MRSVDRRADSVCRTSPCRCDLSLACGNPPRTFSISLDAPCSMRRKDLSHPTTTSLSHFPSCAVRVPGTRGLRTCPAAHDAETTNRRSTPLTVLRHSSKPLAGEGRVAPARWRDEGGGLPTRPSQPWTMTTNAGPRSRQWSRHYRQTCHPMNGLAGF
jgi:hypothetical protein